MKKEDTKKKILKAALACFNEKGFVNTCMNDIVARSGVSKGGIYWHFKSKEEIFVQMIENDYDTWIPFIKEELSKIDDPIEKLRHYGYHFYSLIDEPVWRLLPESYWGEMGEHYIDRLNICYDKDDALIREIFVEAIEKDLVILEDPDELTWIYISTVEGLFAKLSLSVQKKNTIKNYFYKAIDLFLNSIIKK